MSKEERYKKTERAKRQLIDRFTREEPTNWQLPRNVALKNYAEAWADEILPIAREAHQRLRFTNVHAQHEENRVVATGVARERSAPFHVAYADWAAKIVREELHKAGWRLGDLLKQALTSTTASAPSAPSNSGLDE